MTKARGSKKLPLEINITGTRVTIETVVAVCHLISFIQISLDKSVVGLRWTLLTLCLTTFNTVIQFSEEAGWKYKGKVIFNLPFWGIVGMIFLIMASYIVPQLSVVTEHRTFAIFVSGFVATRQVIHAREIYKIFDKNKKGN